MRLLKIFILVAALSTLLPTNVNAQIFSEVIDENALVFKVKSIDEFFKRFNYEVNFRGESVGDIMRDEAEDSIMKRKSLMTLLDFDTFLDRERNMDSISSEFIGYVMDNDCKINYSDTTWFAEAFASFKMNGKEYPITIRLNTEHVKDVIYKWVIRDISSPVFSNMTDSVVSDKSIFPGAHGTSFITLPETINLNADSVQSFFYNGYEPDTLSVFACLVMEKKLTMQSVTKVIYHIKVGDYEITVERFEKGDSYNNGWLISKIIINK